MKYHEQSSKTLLSDAGQEVAAPGPSPSKVAVASSVSARGVDLPKDIARSEKSEELEKIVWDAFEAMISDAISETDGNDPIKQETPKGARIAPSLNPSRAKDNTVIGGAATLAHTVGLVVKVQSVFRGLQQRWALHEMARSAINATGEL